MGALADLIFQGATGDQTQANAYDKQGLLLAQGANYRASADDKMQEAALKRSQLAEQMRQIAYERANGGNLYSQAIGLGDNNVQHYTGALTDQLGLTTKQGLLSQIAAGTATPGALNQSLAVLDGKPVKTQDISGGVAFDPYGTTGATVTATPVGLADIALNAAKASTERAQAANYGASTAKTNAEIGQIASGAGKLPAGYIVDPNDPNRWTFKPGGPADPVNKRSNLRPIPPAQNTAIIENTKALQNIDNAIAQIRDATGLDVAPDGAVTPVPGAKPKDPGALGAINLLPFADVVRQRSDPEGVNARASVSQVGSQKFHDLSGAAVTISEAPRLQPFIPGPGDAPDVALTKLANLRREYANVNESLGQTYSEDQGYRSSPLIGKGPTAGASTPTKLPPGFTITKVSP